MPWILAASLLAFAVGSTSAAAEEPRSVVRESAEVTLVEVPVNVLGRDGKPIRGLEMHDFELEDDGMPQTITSLDVVDLTKKVEASPESELAAAGRRHFLLLFDLSFSGASQIVRARAAATLFLDTALAPGDLAAVATTSLDQGARLLVTFTADRRQLAAAVRRIGLPRTEERNVDPLSFALIVPGDPFLSQTTSTALGERAIGMNPIDPTAARIYTMMARKGADNYSETRVYQHLGQMSSLAVALNTVEGRKTIVYFSEGFDGRLLLGSLARERSHEETMADNDAILDGRLWALDVDRRSANTPLQRQLDETLTLFRRSDCVVYPIDIGGLKADGDVSFGAARRGEDALFAFASGTGGELIRNSNDLSSQLRRIVEKTSLTYVLAFQPTKSAGEGKFHELKVRVRSKGARISARSGYYESRVFRALSPFERALSAADVITHEKKESDFPLDVLAMALNEEPMSRVPVLLEVPGRDLLSDPSAERLTLGLYVYAMDEQGRLADFFSRSVALDLARDGARLRDGAFRYYGSLRLAPGKYRIRCFVRDEEKGRFSFRVVPLDVPGLEAGALRALPPLFFSAQGAGISVRDPSENNKPGSEPFELAGDSFIPQLRPELLSGKVARLCLLLYAGGADPGGPLVRLEARVRDAQGRASAPAQFSVIGRTAPDASGLWKLLVEFTPRALPPGNYSLLVSFRDSGADGAPAEAEAPFKIL